MHSDLIVLTWRLCVCYNVDMYVSRAKWKSKNGKVYESVWLRHSYREGRKVRKRSIANLTHYPPEEVAAIELALKHKGDLAVLGSLKGVRIEEGLSVGAVWTVYEVARALGIERVLGRSRAGKLALWQVVARVLEQGSRLSAVRLAWRRCTRRAMCWVCAAVLMRTTSMRTSGG